MLSVSLSLLAAPQPEGLKEMRAMIAFYKENAQILKVG